MHSKHNAGFSLVEILVAIAILGVITVPMLAGMTAAIRVNNTAEKMMRAQLAVSSTVETLMATGISAQMNETAPNGVTIHADKENQEDPYYKVTVSCGGVEVTTYIREKTGGGV